MPSNQTRSTPGPADLTTIDGVPVQAVVTPDDGQAVADLLAAAAERDQIVIPVGGGTALRLGNPPAGADLALSTSKLGGIIDYEPVDLVLSVGAGARLGDVQAVLAEHGQTLPIDPPGGDEATIGGLVATALAGPLRLSAGTLRDLLIGISMAHPSGTLTKAGGMVVKNVSGFDLPRVYHGSLGTLGVILSANFKVLPLPRTEATVLARFDILEAAVRTAATIRQQVVQPAAVEAGWFENGCFAAVRFAGREPSVKTGVVAAAALIGADHTVLHHDESVSWWKRYQAALDLRLGPDEILARCTVRPRETGTLALGINAALSDLGADIRFLGAAAGLGSVLVRFTLADGNADRLGEIQAILLGLATNVTIQAAPPAWKAGIDVWGPAPETLDVMRAMKDQFDPRRVLNRGRYAGHL